MSDDELTVGERLVSIETKINMILARDTDHETRIRKLERWTWVATGIAALAGTGAGATVTQLLIGA